MIQWILLIESRFFYFSIRMFTKMDNFGNNMLVIEMLSARNIIHFAIVFVQQNTTGGRGASNVAIV